MSLSSCGNPSPASAVCAVPIHTSKYWYYVPLVDPMNRARFSQQSQISMGAGSHPYDILVGVTPHIPPTTDLRPTNGRPGGAAWPGRPGNALRYGGLMSNTGVGYYATW